MTTSTTPSTLFLVYLAGLSMLGYLAIDMYLPAFDIIRAQLQTSEGAISASLSLFLAGFAFAQLLWGSLSDKLGRKPILLVGLCLFTLSSLGMLWISNATGLLILRFLQATGVCAAAVLWQALVIDRYAPSQTQKVFAIIMPLVALSPALAPLLGGWIITHYEWTMIFLVLMGSGLLLFIPTLFLHEMPYRTATPSNSVSFFSLLKSPQFSGNVLIYAACSAGFFAWLTGSPFILGKMGYNPSDIGLSYIPQTLAFLIGGYSCRYLLTHINAHRLLPLLLSGYAISMIILFLLALLSTPTLTELLIPFSFMAAMNGAAYPIVVSNALQAYPQDSGKAAALQNALQLGLCFVASLCVSAFIQDPLVATTTVMVLTLFPMCVGYLLQHSKNALN